MKIEIRKDRFFRIQAFMINDLNLKGNELMIYAIIYGYSQNNDKYFTGSLSYLMSWTGISSKTTVLTTLNKLVEKGLLIKKDVVKNNVKYCEYKAIRKINAIEDTEEIVEDLENEKGFTSSEESLRIYNNKFNNISGGEIPLLNKNKWCKKATSSRKIDRGYIKTYSKGGTKIPMGISKNTPNNIDIIYINNIIKNIDTVFATQNQQKVFKDKFFINTFT